MISKELFLYLYTMIMIVSYLNKVFNFLPLCRMLTEWSSLIYNGRHLNSILGNLSNWGRARWQRWQRPTNTFPSEIFSHATDQLFSDIMTVRLIMVQAAGVGGPGGVGPGTYPSSLGWARSSAVCSAPPAQTCQRGLTGPRIFTHGSCCCCCCIVL